MAQQQENKQTTAATLPAVAEKNITDSVLNRINVYQQTGDIKIPKDYSPANALKSAWLVLQEVVDKDKRPALAVCSKESIANALLKMVVWGLSPLKKQCDFIVRGNQLCCEPEYTGNIALAVRYGGLKKHKANAIFKGDEFEFEKDSETGRTRIIKHKQTLDSLGGEVIGAYVAYELEDGTKDAEVMSMSMIQAAWNQGAARGNSGAHKNFADQMAIKTVYNRACKLLIRASSDAVLLANDEDTDPTLSRVKTEIKGSANREELSFEDAEIVNDQNTLPEYDSTPEQKEAGAKESKRELFEEDPGF